MLQRLKQWLLFLLLLSPASSFAVDMFTPAPGDKSLKVLAAMFGNLGTFGASDSDAFVGVVGTFNSCVLIIGGILVAYTIFAGTLGTAHDGEMLGRKFSSVWVPIRTSLGTALVLPVVGGGYCIMQAIVGWLIYNGVGLADNVWATYMSSDSIAKQVVVGLENPKAERLAWGVFSSLVCLKGYEQIYNEEMKKTPGVYQPLEFKKMVENHSFGDGASYSIVKFGVPGDSGVFFTDSCGTLTIKSTKPIDLKSVEGSLILSGGASINEDLKSVDVKRAEATLKLLESLEQHSAKFVENPNMSAVDVKNGVYAAANEYDKVMKSAALDVVKKAADFKVLQEASTKDGWMFAGAWYMRMAYLMDVGQKAVANVPGASGVRRAADDLFGQSFVERYALPASKISIDGSGLGPGEGEFKVVGDTKAAPGEQSFLGRITASIKRLAEEVVPNTDEILKKMLGSSGSIKDNFIADAHPVMEMKRIGAWLASRASIMFALYAGATTALGVGGIGAALGAGLMPVVMVLFPTMMALSFTLSYVLPMMPFMIWMGVFLGWVILCVEAIIAAPVWAVMHLSPNGDDLVGTAGQGYRLVLSLVLRPVLMVFGLIASLTIIAVFAPMINRVFMDVFVLSQQDSNVFSLLVGFLAAPMLYLGFMWVLITKTLNIIHILPDQLLQWFGGGGPQLGDYGQTFGSQGSQSFAAIGGMGQTFGRMIDAKRNYDDLRKQAKQVDHAAAETHRGSIDSHKRRIDNISGAGSGDIIEKTFGSGGLKKSGFSSQSVKDNVDKAFGGAAQMRAVEMLDQASEALGGSNTPEAVAFRENMNADMSAKADGTPGMTFDEAYEKNFNKSLEEKYGSAGAKYLKDSTGQKYSGPEFDRSMKRLDYVSKFYDKLPPSQKLRKINKLFEEAEGIAKRNPSKSLTEAVDNAIDEAFKNSKSGDKSFGGFQKD